MKRLLIVFLLLAMTVSTGMAAERLNPANDGFFRQVTVVKIFSAETITASGTAESDPINIANAVGDFSLQMISTGSGTITMTYLVSLDGENWVTPSGASAIVTDQAAGDDVVSFDPEMAPWIKLLATESGGVASATITAAYLAIK